MSARARATQHILRSSVGNVTEKMNRCINGVLHHTFDTTALYLELLFVRLLTIVRLTVTIEK